MKMWLKILSVVLIVAFMVTVFALLRLDDKECGLCTSFRYHAPCLIDLETGEMVELALYDPHPTKTAELAEIQTETDTFSFVRLGNATGVKMAAQRTIEVRIPTADKAKKLSLCASCIRLLQKDYCGRYALADLYEIGTRRIFPIMSNTIIEMRCYYIFIALDEYEENIIVKVHGLI